MLYSNVCGFKVNLVKSGVFIGCSDLILIFYDAFVSYDAFVGRKKFAEDF